MSKQNTGRKFFATAATAALVASAIVPVASAAEFTDADQIASWATEAVEALAANEVISGNPDGSFNPAGTVTRAEAAKMFTVALGLDTKGTETFADVKDGQWFQEYVVAVVNAGIVNGMTTTEFAPNGKLTREQAAKMIVEAYGLEGEADLSAFADAKSVAGKWSEGYLATAVENGIIAGKGDKLAATDSISRQEFAVMLNRAINVETVDTAAVLAEAVKALETATAALTTEVAIEKIAEAKATVATANEAITAVEEAAKAAELTEEEAKEVATKVEAAKKAVETTEAAIAKAEEAAKELAVETVTAINATQIEVKFTKAVDAKKLFTNGVSGAFASTVEVKVESIDTVPTGALTGTLSADGKTLVVTAVNTLEKRYDVTIKNVTATDDKKMKDYNEMITIAADKTAPTIVTNVQDTAVKSTVKFSEPIKSLGTVTYTLENGTTVTDVSSTLSANKQELLIDLSAAKVDGELLASATKVVVTFVGVQDQNNNLLTPNPAKVTLTVGAKDGVKPEVSSIAQTGAKEFTIQFSEELQTVPTVTVAGVATTVVKDKEDAKKYIVTTTQVLNDAMTVAVSAFKDLSGEVGTNYSKVVTFKKDVDAAKVISSTIVKDETTGTQFLEFTFDKNVELATAAVTVKGSHVKDYVTVGVNQTSALTYKDAAKNKKVVRVELATLLNKADAAATAYKVGAVYNLTATFTGVKSETEVAVTSTPVNFTLVADGTASVSDKVKVTEVKQVVDNNNEVTVKFDGNVDLATATDASNYSIAGATVASVKAASATTDTVTLVLAEGTSEFTGIRNVVVKNVKKLNGTVTMDEQTIVSEVLNENIAPTVVSAELTGTKTIKVTFSEELKVNGSAADFELFVAGVKADNVITTGDLNGKVLTLTLTSDVDSATITKGLSIKASATIDLADLAGNVVSTPVAKEVK